MTAETRLRDKYGYAFNESGELRQIVDDSISDKCFEFDVFEGDQAKNQERYEAIGELIDEVVYMRLESDCGLQRVSVAVKEDDDNESSPKSFIFISPDLSKWNKLLVIIHGMGVVRAGQFARRLIINDGLDKGSQIPFIKRAQELGFAVLVTNTNYTKVDDVPIPGSSTAHKHARSVWEQFVLPQKELQHVAILAHSFGGAVTLKLATIFTEFFKEHVFAILFTDAFQASLEKTKPELAKYLAATSVNFVASSKPLNTELGSTGGMPCRSAGHTKHEWTSISAIEPIFEELTKRMEKRMNESVEQKAN